MKEKYEALFKKMMNTKGLVIILLIGIGLLLLPGQTSQKEETSSAPTSDVSFISSSEYEKRLESRLADILGTLDGVSQVRVMITLEDSGEVYYAQDRVTNEKGTGDSGLSEHSLQADEAFVLKNDSGGGQSPVILKTKAPRVSGVLVTARGADDPNIQTAITNAVRAVLDVSAHRVKVLGKS